MTLDRKDATYIGWPVHETTPTAHVMGERLHRHFHTNVTFSTDWNRGITTLRIVAPHEAVRDALEMYLMGRAVEYTITREAI